MTVRATLQRAAEQTRSSLETLQRSLRRKMRILPGDRRFHMPWRKKMTNKDRDREIEPGSILEMMARGNATPPQMGSPIAEGGVEDTVDAMPQEPKKPIVSINGRDVGGHEDESDLHDDERAA